MGLTIEDKRKKMTELMTCDGGHFETCWPASDNSCLGKRIFGSISWARYKIGGVRFGNQWNSSAMGSDASAVGGYQGTCVMCRASVEALLHLAMTRRGVQATLAPRTSWGELESWASRKGLLKGIKRKVDRVHKSGNFGAHLAQKIDLGYTMIPLHRTRGILLRLDKETAANRIIETAEIITEVTERRWP